MAPEDRNTTQILIQIAGDIGRTREATETLKDQQSVITDDIKDIKAQLSHTVKTPTCDERHRQVSRSMEIVKGEIIQEIKRSGSSLGHQAITTEMMRSASAPTVQEMETALEEKAEARKEKRRKVLIAWLAIISTVSGLFVGGAIGVYKFAVFANKLEAMVTTSNQEVRSEIKNSKLRKVVYVKDPTPPDVDEPTPPPLPPKPEPAPKKMPAKKSK